MKHPDNDDHIRLDAIEESKREPVEGRTPRTSVNDLIHLWMLSDEASRHRGCVEKAVTKPRPLLIVPPAGRRQVSLGGRP